jgi:hypothetical protein
MQPRRRLLSTMLTLCLGLACIQVASAADGPLPSWQDGPARRAIMDFVKRVTTPKGRLENHLPASSWALGGER